MIVRVIVDPSIIRYLLKVLPTIHYHPIMLNLNQLEWKLGSNYIVHTITPQVLTIYCKETTFYLAYRKTI